MILEYKINEQIDIKSFLLNQGLSKRLVTELLYKKENVYVNGIKYQSNPNLQSNDVLCVEIVDKESSVLAVDKPITIVYENEYFLVVDKEKDLSVIPSHAHFMDNLAGRVLNYFNKNGIDCGVHVVNRLDYMTSGLVIFCKSRLVHQQFAKIDITKKYQAIVGGAINKSGEIKVKIDRLDGAKRGVVDGGKLAITQYSLIKNVGDDSLVDISLLTGRTHQIRVSFAHIGSPLVGDKLYGGKDGEFYLRCYHLSFNFPLDNKKYDFTKISQ